MIVIYRNGQRTVITGWRAWLVTAVAVSIAALSVILLFAIPVAIALALIANAVMPKR